MTASASVVEAVEKAAWARYPKGGSNRHANFRQAFRFGAEFALNAPQPAEQDAREAVIAGLRLVRSDMTPSQLERCDSDGHAQRIDAAIQLISALTQAAPDGWRPIETAPKAKSAIDDLVDRFTAALRDKLHAAEAKYGHNDGWMRDDWQEALTCDLSRHVKKGDPRDVAAYCAFAWHHGWSTASPSVPESVYWSKEHENFYRMDTRAGCGLKFYAKWRGRVSEFPTAPCSSAATADKLREEVAQNSPDGRFSVPVKWTEVARYATESGLTAFDRNTRLAEFQRIVTPEAVLFLSASPAPPAQGAGG
jgi:hypothetical protein